MMTLRRSSESRYALLGLARPYLPIVNGQNNKTGNAVVEVYELPGRN